MLNVDQFERFYGSKLSLEGAKEFLKLVESEKPSDKMHEWKEGQFECNGYRYNLDNLGAWWAKLFKVIPPKDLGELLIERAQHKRKDAKAVLGDGVCCKLEAYLSDIKQVVFPELAVEAFRQDILKLMPNYLEKIHFSNPVIHYSSDNETANVFFAVSSFSGAEKRMVDYSYVIVCKRA